MPPPSATDPSIIASAADKETARLEAFSDGVFAIAMTLLVLELKVPLFPAGPGMALSSRALLWALWQQWPGYMAFLTSFFAVLVMWVHHHAIFKLVRGTDALLLFANGFLLLLVTAVPFPTAVVAQYFRTPAAPAACAVYAGTFVLVGAAFYLLTLAAFRQPLLLPSASREAVARFRKSYRVGPVAYLLATAAAPISPWLSMGICTALWIFWTATATAIDLRWPPSR